MEEEQQIHEPKQGRFSLLPRRAAALQSVLLKSLGCGLEQSLSGIVDNQSCQVYITHCHQDATRNHGEN